MSKTKRGDYTWDKSLRACYDKALAQYQDGNRSSDTYFTRDAVKFLRSVGSKPSEMYVFAEDAQALDWAND